MLGKLTKCWKNSRPKSVVDMNPAMSKHHKEKLFLVEGTLGELQIARTKVNLLAQIDQHVQTKNAIAGAAAALSGLHGLAANAATIALYDGEDAYHFAATLDGEGQQVVCGTFEHANQLQNGDPVKVVVSKRGDVLFAHAIMHAKTQQFYMPLNTWAGDGAIFMDCMKVGLRMGIFIAVCFLCVFFSCVLYDGVFSDLFKIENLIGFAMGAFFSLLLCILFELWTYSTVRGDGRAEAIFKAFGFPRPKFLDLTEVGCMNHEEQGWQYAWQADKMLEKLKAKKRS
jgi:hypothetical protein